VGLDFVLYTSMNVVYNLGYMVKYVSVALLVGDLFLINFFVIITLNISFGGYESVVRNRVTTLQYRCSLLAFSASFYGQFSSDKIKTKMSMCSR
jgi:hypothetical protein